MFRPLRTVLTLVALAGLAAPLHDVARAQAIPTATPPVTPPPTAQPSAQQMLDLSTKAGQTLGTAHLVEKMVDLTRHRSRLNSSTVGDIDFAHMSLHTVTTIVVTKLTTSPHRSATHVERDTLLGNTLASRMDAGAWTCTDLSALSQGQQPPASQGDIVSAPSNLGPDTVGGVPVWHVQIRTDMPGATLPGQPALDDLYLAQSDYRLIEERVTMNISSTYQDSRTGKNVTVTGVISDDMAYSQYGEQVSFTLPRACR